MLSQIGNEIRESLNDLITIRNEASVFLHPPSESQPPRCGAGVGPATLASVGLFGGGVALGGSKSCGIWNFRGCQGEVQANAAGNRRLSDDQDVLTQFVLEFSTNTMKCFFFLIKNELAALNAVQAEVAPTQSLNWTVIQEQLITLEHNFRSLRDCYQMCFFASATKFQL